MEKEDFYRMIKCQNPEFYNERMFKKYREIGFIIGTDICNGTDCKYIIYYIKEKRNKKEQKICREFEKDLKLVRIMERI